jgi:hypothetical protein
LVQFFESFILFVPHKCSITCDGNGLRNVIQVILTTTRVSQVYMFLFCYGNVNGENGRNSGASRTTWEGKYGRRTEGPVWGCRRRLHDGIPGRVLSSTTWEVKLPARSRFKTGKGKEGACYGGRRGVSQRSSYGATPRPRGQNLR